MRPADADQCLHRIAASRDVMLGAKFRQAFREADSGAHTDAARAPPDNQVRFCLPDSS